MDAPKKEIWKDIKDYEHYQISNLARIFNKKNKNYLKSSSPKHKYIQVFLSKDNKGKSFALHRLVGLAFVDNPENKSCLDHIDGNKRNNNADNLEWVTYKENKKRSVNLKLVSKTNCANEIIEHLDNSGNIIQNFRCQYDASIFFGCSIAVIQAMVHPESERCKKRGIAGKKFFPYKINVSENGILLKTYTTVEECAKDFNLSKSTMAVFLNGNYKRIGKNVKANEKDRPVSISGSYTFEIVHNIPILRLKCINKPENEIWKDITDFENYQISNLGNMYNKITCKKITGSNDGRYLRFNFKNANENKHFAIHRLVAQEFISNPENKPFVNHKDGNTFNNRADNLEWVTQKENMLHSLSIGNHHSAKKIKQYNLKGECVEIFDSIKSASRKLNLNTKTITRLCDSYEIYKSIYIFTYIEEDSIDITLYK